MKLNYTQIKGIATGADYVAEENGVITLHRFTKEQEELYKETNQDFYNKSLSTAGIRLQFKTDSKKLYLNVITSRGSLCSYFSVDVLINEEPIGYLDSFSDTGNPKTSANSESPFGDFSKVFLLGDGIKTVSIHLPWSTITVIKEIAVDDDAFIEAVKPQKKLLAFGDSITHGYNALRPSNRYTAKLADALHAEEFNKAIGGERFFPELAKLKESFIPDYITVAYGTNDWVTTDEETFKAKCRAFYENLSRNYPESRIFALTPIWRKDMHEVQAFGPFEKVEENIRNAVEELKNITVISGFSFVPADEKFYADLRLHPNDEGFELYFKNLYDKIKSEI